MKKGFTLIELLAVIIILAVIALIATPLVLDVVEDARSQARQNSIFGYAEAVKLGVYEHQFKNDGENPVINEDWLDYNVVTKGDTVTCEKVTFHETKGVLLSGCTVGSDETLYYYDGRNVLEEKPTGFDNYFTATNPNAVYKCKRAKTGTLHQETCTNPSTNNTCLEAGYSIGDTIEYGTIKELGTDLESGDALDCDINGDNTFDPETERFYYVSSLYDTTTKTFDDEYAVLIYYINTRDRIPSKTGAAYDENIVNYNGPVTAIKHLPTIEQWTNINLKSTTRAILNEKDGTTTTNGTNTYNLPQDFRYIDSNGIANAARLLTYPELKAGCNNGDLETSCEFLFENTKYSTATTIYDGPWLETTYSSNIDSAYGVRANHRFVYYAGTNDAGHGARPVIEVKYTDILH